jgi:hypothetical protein
MAEDEPSEQPIIRGTCACGQRYRIRNAQPGVIVACPSCARGIYVLEADLRAAAADDRLMPLQIETDEAPEAVLLDVGDIRVADAGSRPGLTGTVAYRHDDERLMSALSRPAMGLLEPPASRRRPRERWARLRRMGAGLAWLWGGAGRAPSSCARGKEQPDRAGKSSGAGGPAEGV